MFIAQWNQLGQPGWIGTIAILAVACSSLAAIGSFAYQYLKLIPELKSIQAEITSKSADTLEKLHKKRDDYNDAVDIFKDTVVALQRAIESASSFELDQLREDCCTAITSGVLRAHIKQVDFERLYYEHNPSDMLDFIEDDLSNDIDRFTRWIKLLNSQKLLNKIHGNRSKLIITEQTAKPWYRLINALPDHMQQSVKDKFWENHLTPLLQAGSDEESPEN